MTQDEIMGLVRQAATIIGTALAGRGIIGQGEIELLVGLALIVASAVWSWYAKRRAKQIAAAKIEAALSYSPPEGEDVRKLAQTLASDKVSVAEAWTLKGGQTK